MKHKAIAFENARQLAGAIALMIGVSFSAFGQTNYVDTSGDTMTGPLFAESQGEVPAIELFGSSADYKILRFSNTTNDAVWDISMEASDGVGLDYLAFCYSPDGVNLYYPFYIDTVGILYGNGSGLTDLNSSSLIGPISSEQLPDSGTWNVSGMTIDNLDLSGSTGDGSGLSNLTVNTGNGAESLDTVVAEIEDGLDAVYSSAVSITVQIADNETTNGAALLAAYAAARDMAPTENNRIVVIVPPGRYDLGEEHLLLDMPYIDLIGSTTDRAVQYIYGTPGFNDGVIRQTADHVRIENLTIDNRSNASAYPANLSVAYYPTVPGSNTVLRNCRFISETTGTPVTMRIAAEYAGLYEHCQGGDYSFGGSLWASGTASGTFIDCTGGAYSFGQTASGSFRNCRGGNHCFAGGMGGTASGTFTGCVAGNQSFASEFGTASGTFTDCVAGNQSFGGEGWATASGTFTDCVGGNDSFGGGYDSTASGAFTGCVAGGGSFGGGYGNTASGTFTDCIGGNGSFGGDSGTASGTFTDCVAGDDSFGGDYGTASGTFDGCVGGIASFGGAGTASGSFTDCRGDWLSFGGGDSGTVSGSFTDCIGGRGSFGGGIMYLGSYYGGTLLPSSVLQNCTAGANSFGDFNMAATNFSYNAEGYTFAGGPIRTGPYGDIPMFVAP